MPKVSVVIPVYNTEKFLAHCLNSVLSQSVQDFEAICINDGSTDGSLKILEEYASKDQRIKVISQENKGQSAARNRAMPEISGDYVFFLDSDDFIHPQTFEILLKVAEKTGCAVVSTTETKQYGGDKFYNTDDLQFTVHQEPLKHILTTNIASSSVIWNKLYKAELVRNRPFIEGIYFEDWPWVTCLFAGLNQYAVVPYALNGYNNENQSTMRSAFNVRKVNDYVTGIKAVQDFFAEQKYASLWPIVRAKRIGASIKMMINKTYHEKSGQPDLNKYLSNRLNELHKEKAFCYFNLPMKTLWRLAKIQMRLRGK